MTKMMESTRKNTVIVIATRRIVLKLFLIATLLGASVVVCQADVFFWGDMGGGYTGWLHCGTSAGNFWTVSPPCPPGESCLCEVCETQSCLDTATYQCRQLGYLD